MGGGGRGNYTEPDAVNEGRYEGKLVWTKWRGEDREDKRGEEKSEKGVNFPSLVVVGFLSLLFSYAWIIGVFRSRHAYGVLDITMYVYLPIISFHLCLLRLFVCLSVCFTHSPRINKHNLSLYLSVPLSIYINRCIHAHTYKSINRCQISQFFF